MRPPAVVTEGPVADPLDAFGRILALLHEATLDDARWPAAAALIEEACGAAGSALTVGERSGDDVRVHFYSLLYRGEPAQDLARQYFDLYLPLDEGPPRLWERPAGRVVHVPDLYTDRELKKSRAYNEGWRRCRGENGLIARIDGLEGLSIVWGVGNPVDSGGWHNAQLQLFESLVPHVRHFVNVRQALAGADALSTSQAGLLKSSQMGVVHLDRGGHVLAANDSARNILRRGDGLFDRDGALHASLPADHGRLQRLLKQALPVFGNEPPIGGSITIQRPLLRSRLMLHVHPAVTAQADFGGRRVAALVLVVDPESRPRIDPVQVAKLFGLTPSEARVSVLLAEGRSVREIAATAGYKESYVRWLFKQVYRKLRLSGQIALVQRILAAYGMLPH